MPTQLPVRAPKQPEPIDGQVIVVRSMCKSFNLQLVGIEVKVDITLWQDVPNTKFCPEQRM